VPSGFAVMPARWTRRLPLPPSSVTSEELLVSGYERVLARHRLRSGSPGLIRAMR